jgi:hypothetical protein
VFLSRDRTARVEKLGLGRLELAEEAEVDRTHRSREEQHLSVLSVFSVLSLFGALDLLAQTGHLLGGRHCCDNNRATAPRLRQPRTYLEASTDLHLAPWLTVSDQLWYGHRQVKRARKSFNRDVDPVPWGFSTVPRLSSGPQSLAHRVTV